MKNLSGKEGDGAFLSLENKSLWNERWVTHPHPPKLFAAHWLLAPCPLSSVFLRVSPTYFSLFHMGHNWGRVLFYLQIRNYNRLENYRFTELAYSSTVHKEGPRNVFRPCEHLFRLLFYPTPHSRPCVMSFLMCRLGRAIVPVIQSNINLGVAVKVFCKCSWSL